MKRQRTIVLTQDADDMLREASDESGLSVSRILELAAIDFIIRKMHLDGVRKEQAFRELAEKTGKSVSENHRNRITRTPLLEG
jgi:hypothetical protein